MRRSYKRHPLATLRLMLGLTQKELADLAGCAAVTIKSIESGKLALSGKLAEHIGAITGVHEEWLVAGNPKEPIVAEDGTAYTRKHFEIRQAILFDRKFSKKRKAFEQEFTPEVLALVLLKVYSIMRKGHAENRFAWTIYKIQAALEAVERELGSEKGFEGERPEIASKTGTEKLKAAVELIVRAQKS